MSNFLLVFLSLLCLLPAQTVRVANYGAAYEGWVRATVDTRPPHASGAVPGARYVLGRPIGDAWVIDLQLKLAAGEAKEIPLAAANPYPFAIAPLPANPLAFFGSPTIAGVPLQVVSIKVDGAAYLTHLRARVGRMLHADVWTWWQPDQPGWCRGEVVICASNPAVPDMVATVPAGFRLAFGQASAVVPGLAFAELLPAGETLADGQARSFPFTLVWPQHMRSTADWTSAGGACSWSVCANGIDRPWPGGYPALPAGASRLGWTTQHWHGAIERLHSWDWGPLGPVAPGGSSGAQEDQVFVGAECAGLQGLGAETVRYFVALGLSRRPVHHLERDGTLLDPAGHPQLVIWSGRAHWHTGVSPDQLGKPRALNATVDESHGATGQDRQHWFLNTLALAARLTGSPALQWQLSAQGRNFLFQETVDPRLSTSGAPESAREVGWVGIVAAHLHRTAEERPLVALTDARWKQRVLQVYIPIMGSRPGGIWHPQLDARIQYEIGIPAAAGWMPDHQSVGAGGLYLACDLIGPPEGKAMAVAGARAVLERAFTRDGARWVEWERLLYRNGDPLLPSDYTERAGAHRTGWFISAWFPLAAAVALQAEPANERARSIWAQQLADGGGGGSWFWPGLPR